MYTLLVLRCGIDPGYVMDSMTFYEMEYLLDHMYEKEKETWEQTRMLGYITAQCQNKKQLNPKKIMPFMWDDKKSDEEEYVPTEEEKEQMYREMKEMEEQMNKK